MRKNANKEQPRTLRTPMEAPSKLSISDMEADGRSGTRSRIRPAKTPVSSSGPRIAADNQRWECRGQDAGVWGIWPGDRYVVTPPFPQQARLNSSLEVPDAKMRPVLSQIPGSLLIGVLSYAGVGRVLQNIMAFLSSRNLTNYSARTRGTENAGGQLQ